MRLIPRSTLAALVACLALTAVGSRAESARELAWEDLLPPALLDLEREAVALERRLARLAVEERRLYQKIAVELSARDLLASGIVTESGLSEEERQALAESPSATHPEALAFWARVKETQEGLAAQDRQVDQRIDGTRIRLPGYVLPLEFDGTKVREFLLVPFVGACIHTPPPPPNQMVFVHAAESFESAGLFAPVWVEGTMSTQGGTHELSLVDGQAPVDAGYTLDADRIEPYRD